MLLISNFLVVVVDIKFKKPSIWLPHTDFLFSKIMRMMAESNASPQSSSGASRHSANKPAALAPSFTTGTPVSREGWQNTKRK